MTSWRSLEDMVVDYLKSLFAYDDWANREALASLKAVAEPPPRAVQLMAHVVAAQVLWWGRLHDEPPSVAVWPDLTPDECERHLAELRSKWQSYLRGLTAEKLRAEASYTNTKGERWSSAVEDVLRHVLTHGAYHRGQIATHLRAAGHEAAYTDYIHAVRQGLVE